MWSILRFSFLHIARGRTLSRGVSCHPGIIQVPCHRSQGAYQPSRSLIPDRPLQPKIGRSPLTFSRNARKNRYEALRGIICFPSNLICSFPMSQSELFGHKHTVENGISYWNSLSRAMKKDSVILLLFPWYLLIYRFFFQHYSRNFRIRSWSCSSSISTTSRIFSFRWPSSEWGKNMKLVPPPIYELVSESILWNRKTKRSFHWAWTWITSSAAHRCQCT